MKIRLLTSLAGPNEAHDAGAVIERDDAEAKRLIEAGFAEPVRATRTAETTAKSTGKRGA